jgi:O-antigen/teichoic acid export membrane protein
MYVFALYPLISGLENIGTVSFRKELQFDRQFLLVLGARVLGTAVTVVLAWMFKTYWALVLGVLARSSARVVLSYAMHPYRPRLSFAEAHGIFDFSKWVFVQQLIQGLSERIPALVVGRVSGAEALAFFNVGQEIAALGTTALRAPIRQALFSGFAKISGDAALLARAFRDSLAILLLVSLPIPVGIGLMAAHLVRLFLGENWMPMVPVLQILALYGAVSAFGTSSHLIYWTVDRPRITASLSALRLLLLAPLSIWLVRLYGMTGAAWALTISATVVAIADYVVVLRVLDVRLRDLVSKVWRVLVATLVMTVAVEFTLSHLAWSQDVLVLSLQLALGIVIGAAVYLTVLTLLWRASGLCDGPERQTLALLRGLMQRPPATAA